MEDQKQKKPIFKKWWFWILLVVIILIFAGSDSEQSKKVGEIPANNNQQQSSDNQAQYKIGDQIKLGNSIVSVNEVEFSNGGQFSKPQDGNEWVDLNITIENTGSTQQYITTLGQMFLIDGEGNSYQVAVTGKTMSNPNLGLDGTIIAKTKRTGWVGFEIKKGVTGLAFQYNGSMFGGGSVVVGLGR